MRAKIEIADNVLFSDRIPTRIRFCYFLEYRSQNNIKGVIWRADSI